MSGSHYLHVCARCHAEFHSPTAYPPPGWLWRGARLYCDGCACRVADPVDDAAPSGKSVEPTPYAPAPMMLASGKVIDLTAPDTALIAIDDIALALSRICRFAGQIRPRRFYSVAEHSVHVSRRVSPDAALAALLHDATEAYLGDMVRPLKAILPAYREIEDNFAAAIDAAFGIDSRQWRHEIRKADLDMAIIEAYRLMPPDDHYWGTAPDDPAQRIECWYPGEAQRRFRDRFHELTAPAARREAA